MEHETLMVSRLAGLLPCSVLHATCSIKVMEKRILYILLTVFTVILLIGLVVELRQFLPSVTQGGDKEGGPNQPNSLTPAFDGAGSPTIIPADPVLGPSSAPVTIVEFGDYTCEACADAQTELKKALAEFPGLVRIVWKDFPVNLIHAESVSAAVAARCAARQGRFAEYQDALFLGKGLLSDKFFEAVAQSLGLNEEVFKTCQQNPAVKQEVLASRQEGIDLGIDGVPYFFLNNQRINQVLSAELWRENIQKALR